MTKRSSSAISGHDTNHPLLPSPDDSAASSPRSPKRAKSALVDEANCLSADDFQRRYVAKLSLNDGQDAGISLYPAQDMKPTDLDACLSLIEKTSRRDYEASSWGWHPKRKKREMGEKEMRYLIVNDEQLPARNFQGFLSFMLTHDSSPVVPVLYIYEIHLAEQVRGKGLGRHLMASAEDIARKVGVDKVMLTCFKSNTHARSFYESLGYATDACSPGDRRTRKKIVKTDYVIMSRDPRQPPPDRNAEAATQVMTTNSVRRTTQDKTNEVASLDECELAMKEWTEEHKAGDVLNAGLSAADAARREFCLQRSLGNSIHRAAGYRRALEQSQKFLQTRFEAARDFTDILREQMYHLKCQVSDINRLAEITERAEHHERTVRRTDSLEATLGEEAFDMEKATEQVYGAFFTLMRKAEEIDNRLDLVADREEEASLMEYDLGQREDDLDGWESDLREREEALEAREGRFTRARERFKRQVERNKVFHEEEDGKAEQGCREQIQALPWMQESPVPRDKVNTWLQQSIADCGSPEDIM